MRRALALACLLFALPAAGQEDDRGYLTAFLEDNLSGAGRQVTITGFAGALSARATVERMTIADDEGVWITLNGVILDWSRSALLSGEVIVEELSAEEIILARLPITDSSDLPATEAAGFSLPDLPVSVEIGRIAADRIVLDTSVLGQAVEGSLEAALSLSGGEGKASFALLRKDSGPDGEIKLDALYSNLDRRLELSLLAEEGAGGLAVSLLGLPGAPPVTLKVDGSGVFEDFAADVSLVTDGVERLGGKVTLGTNTAAGSTFRAELAGDLAPLFLPDYAAFFGDDVQLEAAGARSALGRLTLDKLDVKTRTLAFAGSAALGSDGLPETLSVTGRLAAPDGAPVLLPFGDMPTRVDNADFDLQLLPGRDGGWKGTFDLRGLDREDFTADHLRLSGSGRIGRTPGGKSLGATLQLVAEGLTPIDPAVAAALGQNLEGTLTAHWLEGSGALTLSELRVSGEGFQGRAKGRVEGLDNALMMTGLVEVTAADLGRFSGLVQQPLGGSGTVELEGSASRLSGFFDLTARFEGQALTVGIAEVDRLMAGQSQLGVSAIRDETGTVIRSFDLTSGGLSITGTGRLSSDGADLKASLNLTDLGVLDRRYRGRVRLEADYTGTLATGMISVDGTASGIGIGQPDADRLLAGESRLGLRISVRDGVVRVDEGQLANSQFSLSANGTVAGGERRITLDARLNDLALLVPEFPGPMTVTGTALHDPAGYQLDLAARGPGQVDARIAGRLAENLATADLTLVGVGQAGMANPFVGSRSISGPVRFDLRLNGPIQVGSLSGRASLSGGRISDTDFGFAFERVEAVADLAGGQARISATTELSTGGRLRLDGPVALNAPHDANLAIRMDQLRLIDPELYRTTASGDLTITGPLRTGALIEGRVNLGETEIRVPSTGIAGDGGLPDLRHVNEPQAVRATRAKAGLIGSATDTTGAGGSGAFRLNVEIFAPNRVFVRGRGIDAELGGSLRITGTTAVIVPSGGFSLIRGRLDILGKRLALSAADLRLEGDFVPLILISANTQSDGVTSFVTVEGPATAPDVRFSSTPDLPQEEVLARLLFGRGLDRISALQAAQLANAVAVLAGRSGEGVIGRLRKSFGLDDLDVTTSEDGLAALRAGKYLSENVYTEVEVGQEGKSRINLNLDIRPGVTLKGRVGADGETGVGIFLERDY